MAGRWLHTRNVEFVRESDNTLWVLEDGQRRPIDRAVRCFPFSSPQGWISLRDEDGVEVGLLKDLENLPEEVRERLEQVLKARYHIPVIGRIHSIESGPAGALWQVETDVGPESFRIRGEQAIDMGAFPRVFLTDTATRRRFEIPDYTALDRGSQTLARHHLPIVRRGGRGGRGRMR